MGKRNYQSFMNQIMEKIMEYDGHIYFLTLTLKDDSVLNKNTIRDFIIKLKYRGVEVHGYLWVKELQKRGVVHYHMIMLVAKKIRNFYTLVSGSWKHGFVFVKGVEKSKIRYTIIYVMKYIRKDLKKHVENEKMKRKLGRGGILRFRSETFVGRIVRFSEFEYVGSGSAKGMRVKIYRCGDLVMFVASGINGVSIDICEWNIEDIIEKYKYGVKNTRGVAEILNDVRYWAVDKVEREDILGYHMFDREINRLLWKLGV